MSMTEAKKVLKQRKADEDARQLDMIEHELQEASDKAEYEEKMREQQAIQAEYQKRMKAQQLRNAAMSQIYTLFKAPVIEGATPQQETFQVARDVFLDTMKKAGTTTTALQLI